MQRHRGLPGARPTLDHQDALRVRSDRLILLRLNGGDDVVHPTRAVRAERSEERTLAGESGAVALLERLGVQQVVLHAHHSPPTGGEMTASHDISGLCRRGLVEGPCGGRAPVGQQR